MTAVDKGTGVWLIGARGSVATTVVAGAAAVRAGLADLTGCVTAQPQFASAGLADIAGLVFGGHDVAETSLVKRAEQLTQAGVLPARMADLVAGDLNAADERIRPGGPLPDDRRSQAELAGAFAADLVDFRSAHRLRRVVVINVSSTEPPLAARPEHDRLADLEHELAAGRAVLPPSSLYAYAALTAGCPYVEFTPSPGVRLPALDELARARGLPYAGCDAKTGETLVSSALAPMFAARALQVNSWSGTNLLGGGDGATLADPRAAASKTSSKRRGLERMLGQPVQGAVHIDNVPGLGEWKTAWDHIAFSGFLGVRMNLQFTWQGCDSALAAPLVLDLARLVARAHEAGVAGPFDAAGFFFKDPVPASPGAAVEHRLAEQYSALLRWISSLAESP